MKQVQQKKSGTEGELIDLLGVETNLNGKKRASGVRDSGEQKMAGRGLDEEGHWR